MAVLQLADGRLLLMAPQEVELDPGKCPSLRRSTIASTTFIRVNKLPSLGYWQRVKGCTDSSTFQSQCALVNRATGSGVAKERFWPQGVMQPRVGI